MSADDAKPHPGQTVALTSIPPGLLNGLPQEDQNAIVAIVGKPVLLVEYEDGGQNSALITPSMSDGRTLPHAFDVGAPGVHRAISGVTVKRRAPRATFAPSTRMASATTTPW
jgi:hypothetical protein